MNFSRAADKLEEQLVQLSAEDSPHKGSDLHVDVLVKYGGVLWWDGDAEGAVDAFTAADEALLRRGEPEDPAGHQTAPTAVKRRRADIWAQMAQVYRACGDFDAADKHLSDAVASLTALRETETAASSTSTASAKGLPPAGESTSSGMEEMPGSSRNAGVVPSMALLGDALRDAQAALGQVCVQKKDYARAEQLYCAAFSVDSRELFKSSGGDEGRNAEEEPDGPAGEASER
jgi:hypothetical protein